MTDLTPNDLSHMSDEDFNALCPQGEHAPGPEPLSPAAQAVMIAATNGNTNVVNDPVYRQCIAAALEAVADQVVPDNPRPSADSDYHLMQWSKSLDQYAQRQQTRAELLAIAAELDGHHD